MHSEKQRGLGRDRDRKSPLFLPVCLFPSTQPLCRHVEINVSLAEYFWMAATCNAKSAGTPNRRPSTVFPYLFPAAAVVSANTTNTLAVPIATLTVPRDQRSVLMKIVEIQPLLATRQKFATCPSHRAVSKGLIITWCFWPSGLALFPSGPRIVGKNRRCKIWNTLMNSCRTLLQ